jgi:sporulation integral membrane protein YtvI
MEKKDIDKKQAFLINFAYFIIILALAYIALKYAIPLLGPFVIAFLIASMLQKPICFIQKKRKFNKRICSVAAVALFFFMIGGLISIAGVEAISGVQKLIQLLPNFYTQSLEPLVLEIFDKLEQGALRMDVQLYIFLANMEEQFLQYAGELASKLSMSLVSAVSGLAASIPAIFIKLVILIISTFFIAMDYDKLMGFCMNQLSEGARKLTIEIKTYVVGTLWVCIRSYALIMSITFVELSIGLSLIGIKNAVLIAACISIFDVLPVLGTGGIMIPWTVTAAVLGDFRLSISLLLVYVVITVIRNILEPKIVGGQLGLHPVVTLSSMFAGVQLLGVIGLFGFPIFLSLLCNLDKTGAVKLFKKTAVENQQI